MAVVVVGVEEKRRRRERRNLIVLINLYSRLVAVDVCVRKCIASICSVAKEAFCLFSVSMQRPATGLSLPCSQITTVSSYFVSAAYLSLVFLGMLTIVHTPSIAFWHLPPNSARTSYATEGRGTLYLPAAVHRRCQRPPKGLGTNHTPSIAFRHLPPNSARFSYATEGALFISAQLSTDAVSTLRKVWVLIKL